MAKKRLKTERENLKALLSEDRNLMKGLLQEMIQEILEAEMSEALGAAPREHTADRQGYGAAGYYQLTVPVRVQGNRVMRTRPIFRHWEAAIAVKYLDGLLNASEVEQFLKVGGILIGLGDWRPKFGRFVVA